MSGIANHIQAVIFLDNEKLSGCYGQCRYSRFHTSTYLYSVFIDHNEKKNRMAAQRNQYSAFTFYS